jgi:hypothetical protein
MSTRLELGSVDVPIEGTTHDSHTLHARQDF